MQATDKQINFISALLNDRQLPDEARERGKRRVMARDFDIETASKTISYLLKQPKIEVARTPIPEVPEGRYAVKVAGVLKFYKVDRPTEGRWAGRTFVNVQASDDFHPVKDPEQRKAILAAIAKDPEKAFRAYGLHLGVCGICGRKLTDAHSRAAGIGPICAQKYGYAFAPAEIEEDATEVEPVKKDIWADPAASRERLRAAAAGNIPGNIPTTFSQLKESV